MTKAEYERECYYWLKEHGICVNCRAENAVKGKVMCSKCAKTKSENKLVWLDKKFKSDENYKSICRERSKKACKRRRDYRRENGLCLDCGKSLPDNKYKRCAQCRAKWSARRKQKRVEKGCKTYDDRVSGEYCFLCLTPLENPDRSKGAQLCEKCRVQATKNLEKGRAALTEDNMFRRLDKAYWREREAKNDNRGKAEV